MGVAMDHGLPTFRISTEDFAERDRASARREFVGSKLLNVEIEPLPERSFASEGTAWRLPGVDIFAMQCSGAHYRTTSDLLANDDIALLFSSAPRWRAWQLGREAILGSGDAILSSNAEASGMISCLPGVPAGAVSIGSVCVSRRSLARLVPDIEASLLRPIAAQSQAMRLLQAYVAVVKEPGAGSAEAQQLAGQHILDLVALAVGASRDIAENAREGGVRAARLAAAKSIIARELDDPHLSVVDVARRLKVSPRYMQMLFEGDGTTFSNYVLSQRLERVFRLLRDPRFGRFSISDIAFDAGFGGLAHFNRAFRRRYGATPSEVRAAGRGA